MILSQKRCPLHPALPLLCPCGPWAARRTRRSMGEGRRLLLAQHLLGQRRSGQWRRRRRLCDMLALHLTFSKVQRGCTRGEVLAISRGVLVRRGPLLLLAAAGGRREERRRSRSSHMRAKRPYRSSCRSASNHKCLQYRSRAVSPCWLPHQPSLAMRHVGLLWRLGILWQPRPVRMHSRLRLRLSEATVHC